MLVPSWTMRNGAFLSGSCRKVVDSLSILPLSKSAFSRWKNSMASDELAFVPKPLSVSTRNSPLPSERMPEKPCTGCPAKGVDSPVGRPAERPMTAPTCPTRLPGIRNLPDTLKSSGASAGAGMMVLAGSSACPSSLAGNSFGPSCAKAESADEISRAAARETRMGRLQVGTRWPSPGSPGLQRRDSSVTSA